MTRANCVACAMAACFLSALAGAQPATEPKPDVAGVTVDSKGEALRKVTLILYPMEPGPAGDPLPPSSAISDRDGKFAFFGVPPGRYKLEADHAGYLRVKFGARNTWADGTLLTVVPGRPLAGLEIRMPEQATVAGTVSHDESASFILVSLLQPAYQDGQRRLHSVATAQANDSGEFSFNKLAPGRYYLTASAPPGAQDPNAAEAYVTTYYPGTADAGSAEAIDLKRGQSVSGLQFPVRKSRLFRISGTVEGYGSNPGRVAILLRPAGPSANFMMSAPVEDGAFEFRVVLPGSYWLVSMPQGSSSVSVAPQAVEVSSDVSGIRLKAEPPVKLAGTLKVEGGPTAIPGLQIRLVPPAGLGLASPAAEVKSDGSFALTAPSGRYRIDFQGLPADAFVKSAALGDQDVLGGLEANQSAGANSFAIVISRAGARVTGVVHDGAGKSVYATVSLIPDPPRPGQPSLYQVGETADDGRFQMQGIRPGKYRLYAWEELEPGAHLDPQFTAPHEADSVAIEVAENDHKEVTLARIPAGETEVAK